MTQSILEACGVTKYLIDSGKNRVAILDGIDICLYPGEQMVLTGSSGTGKSTLLHILAGFEAPDAGTVHVAGSLIKALTEAQRAKLRLEKIGFVHQNSPLLPSFTLMENVAIPLLISGISSKIALERAQFLIQSMNLDHRLHQYPETLSGGEKQRAAIARALVHKPALLIADEPTGSLDKNNAIQCAALMKALVSQEHSACLLVTHDTELAAQWPIQVQLESGKLWKR